MGLVSVQLCRTDVFLSRVVRTADGTSEHREHATRNVHDMLPYMVVHNAISLRGIDPPCGPEERCDKKHSADHPVRMLLSAGDVSNGGRPRARSLSRLSRPVRRRDKNPAQGVRWTCRSDDSAVFQPPKRHCHGRRLRRRGADGRVARPRSGAVAIAVELGGDRTARNCLRCSSHVSSAVQSVVRRPTRRQRARDSGSALCRRRDRALRIRRRGIRADGALRGVDVASSRPGRLARRDTGSAGPRCRCGTDACHVPMRRG